MKRLLTISIFLSLLFSSNGESLKISVDAGEYDRENTVVRIDVAGLKGEIKLFETTSGKMVEHSCQRDEKHLFFILDGKTPKGTSRQFLVKSAKKTAANDGPMAAGNDGNSITLTSEGKKILSYVYTLTMPPKGVDTIFARSGYIHPAYTPSGFELTTIQPEDHRHHYGIWNPWTKLEYAGEEYDLWNLGDGKGTVRARSVNATYSGKIMSGFEASLDHNIKKNGTEKTILGETWKVCAWNCEENGFLWDFESELSPSTDNAVLLKEYRYAGFGFRANKHWTKDNCQMVSSEGHLRNTIDGTRGRWIYTVGDIGNDRRGGILIMASTKNYNYPEPLRIWDENAAGKGYVYMNFVPTKNMDWNLEPGKRYRLCYRIFAFDGEMTPELAERLWTDFAYPPTVKPTVNMER